MAAKPKLIGRNQANPEKYIKAIVVSDEGLEEFAVSIKFNFKSADKSSWDSKLLHASAADEGDEDDEDFGDDEFEDEDFEDEEFDDEEFEDEEEDEDL